MASKQAQAVTAGLCLTLASVISHTATNDLREKLLGFLSKLLAEKLSYSTKRAEFVIISAVASSISKILRDGHAIPNQEGIENFYLGEKNIALDANKLFGFAIQILLADLDKIGQYKTLKSACKLLSTSYRYISSCDWSRTQVFPYSLCFNIFSPLIGCDSLLTNSDQSQKCFIG